MNRKAENEFKQLVKLGVPEETAKLIAVSKLNVSLLYNIGFENVVIFGWYLLSDVVLL